MNTTELIAFLQRIEAENGPLPVWLCHGDTGYYPMSMAYVETANYFQAIDGTNIELPDRLEIFVG